MTGMDERCRCGQPADFRCESRKVGAFRKIRRNGMEVDSQPYLDYFLCARCTAAEIKSDDPPRAVEALPHHAAVLRRQEREAVKALFGSVEQERLGDWGLPT